MSKLAKITLLFSWIKTINTRNWNIVWTINLRCLTLKEIETSKKFNEIGLPKDWLENFGLKKIYTKDLTTNINYSPNFIRTRVMNLLTNKLIKLPIISFKEY